MAIFVVSMEPNRLKKSHCDVETNPVVTQHVLESREQSKMEKKKAHTDMLITGFVL